MKPAMKSIIKRAINILGLDIRKLMEGLSAWSIKKAYTENDLYGLAVRLREIVPNISSQEDSEKDTFNAYWELKRRTLQAFQCHMMLKALEYYAAGDITVVDIGDSAGTHMLYLRELTRGKFCVDTISVNLDQRCIEKITARGLRAILCRAEELDLGTKVDLFTSFQMVEHLHNPAIFFRRLAVRSDCERMLITVPYLKRSRVGLHQIRQNTRKPIFAGDEHIFELSPEDWTLLLLHSGWKVKSSQIYYQYPRRWPIARAALAWFWKNTDYEGFWGAILEKDMTYSNAYQDWED
jgi:hypothetical protein